MNFENRIDSTHFSSKGILMFVSLKTLLPTIFFLPVAASASTCSQLIGTCAYYDCVESETISCGQGGYTLAYGKYYCEKFDAVIPNPYLTEHERELFPVEWDSWLSKTAQCLHSAIDAHLDSTPAKTCENLRAAAFASHADCYTKGESFCFLPPRQIATIGRIISARGFAEPETRAQVAQTAPICVEQFDRHIESETSARNRFELTIYRNAWARLQKPR